MWDDTPSAHHHPCGCAATVSYNLKVKPSYVPVAVAGAVVAVAGRNMGSSVLPTSAALAGAMSAVAISCARLGLGSAPPHRVRVTPRARVRARCCLREAVVVREVLELSDVQARADADLRRREI